MLNIFTQKRRRRLRWRQLDIRVVVCRDRFVKRPPGVPHRAERFLIPHRQFSFQVRCLAQPPRVVRIRHMRDTLRKAEPGRCGGSFLPRRRREIPGTGYHRPIFVSICFLNKFGVALVLVLYRFCLYFPSWCECLVMYWTSALTPNW
jgi:hypothetical protein